jgi:hypothetical protein
MFGSPLRRKSKPTSKASEGKYELVDEARRHGFQNVEVIDDDLGRSASGITARPGFERLLAWLCAGEVGAVLCFDASRLARNRHDWHHLLELCGLVKARVIDLDGIYDPCRPNDRLLLGMKGSISEFELGVHGIHAYRSAEKNGEWLTMSDAAKLLGVSNHAIRRLIKETESLPQSKSSPKLRIKYAPAIYKTKKSSTRSPEILARVASKWKTSLQCFQTLEKGVHNESLIAMGRMARSTGLLSSSMRPSPMKRVRPSHRDNA